MNIPPLAGLATYADTAWVGFSVDENIERLLPYSWFKKRAGEQKNWWPEFVRAVLGQETAVEAFDLKRL